MRLINCPVMSESTEELKAEVQGTTEVLVEVENLVDQLGGHATEMAEEASEHGWHGMAVRMEEAAVALKEAAAGIGTAKGACEAAADELGSISEEIPAPAVVTHLTTSTTQLGDAVSAIDGAVDKADEARTAVSEVGQECMMDATSDVHRQLTEVHERVARHQAASESERVAADAFVKQRLGN